MPKTEEERKAREAINDCIAGTESSDMKCMMDAGRLSHIRKKKEEREWREFQSPLGISGRTSGCENIDVV